MLAGCLLLLAGCRDGQRQASEGTVTLDGQPLSEGTITFLPQSGTAGPTAGGTITMGRFSVPAEKGTFSGAFRVEITAQRKTGRRINSDTAAGMVDQREQFLPARYNRESQLTAEVKPGPNQFEFKLTSK